MTHLYTPVNVEHPTSNQPNGELPFNDKIDRQDSEAAEDYRLGNTIVTSFSWHDCNVHVKDRETKEQRAILYNATGIARAGMQTSGSNSSQIYSAV